MCGLPRGVIPEEKCLLLIKGETALSEETLAILGAQGGYGEAVESLFPGLLVPSAAGVPGLAAAVAPQGRGGDTRGGSCPGLRDGAPAFPFVSANCAVTASSV